jgi:hypothetical protein
VSLFGEVSAFGRPDTRRLVGLGSVIGHEDVVTLTVFPEHHTGYTQVKRRERGQLRIIQLQAWTDRVEPS